jgi:hypothetical protein
LKGVADDADGGGRDRLGSSTGSSHAEGET